MRSWAFGATYWVFWCVNKVKSMRVRPKWKKKAWTFLNSGCRRIPKMRPFLLHTKRQLLDVGS